MKKKVWLFVTAIALIAVITGIIWNSQNISESLMQMQLKHAVMLDENKEYDKAAKIYALLLKKNPKQTELYLKLAKTYYLSGDEKQAADVLKLGMEHTGDKIFEDQLSAWGYGEAEWKVKRIDESVKNENGEILVNIYCDLVYTDNKKESSQKINAFLKQKADEILKQKEKQRDENIPALGLDLASVEIPFEACTDAEIVYVDENYLSVRWTDYLYWGGTYTVNHTGDVFSLETGELLELQEIFDFPQSVLTEYLKFVVTEYMSDNGDENSPDGDGIHWYDDAYELIMGYELQDFEFYLRDGSPVLCFEKYLLTTGSEGDFEIPCGLTVGKNREFNSDVLYGS